MSAGTATDGRATRRDDRASARTFRLPDLGEGLTEADVVRWLIAEGDEVAVDQPVVEVETAKAMVELPSPYAGQATTLHAAAGQTVPVGAPLLTVSADVPPTTALKAHPDEADTDEADTDRESAGSGNVLTGYGTRAAAGPRRHRRPRGSGPPATASPATPTRPAPTPAAPTTATPNPATPNPANQTPPAERPRVVSPLVRRLAGEWGIDLRTVAGSGHAGLILREDVERAAARRRAEPPEPAAGSRRAEPPAEPSQASPGEHRIPLSGFRKAVSTVLSRSRAEIPEATIWVDVDATELVALREAGRTASRPGPGLLAYLARFTIVALREYPVLNARLDAAREEIVQLDRINLGIAVQGERGLLVPAVLGAEALSTTALDAEIRRVTAAARVGQATAEELSAGTFTLNNYGGFGVDGSAAIINHPQVAILGVGRVVDRPWVLDGAIVVRKLTQLSFVFDHRVCDGATAAGFVRLVADLVENPAAAIAHL